MDDINITSEETSNLAEAFKNLRNKNIVLVLKPEQINILGQVFRPIFSGKISELTDSYIILDKVNMKISSAPEFIFPTSLTIPLNQIALFLNILQIKDSHYTKDSVKYAMKNDILKK